jgi:hypothetical protein
VGSSAGEGFSTSLPFSVRFDRDAWVSLLEHIAVLATPELRTWC